MAQAYVDLLCASDGDLDTRTMSLVWIGDHEIRIFVFSAAADDTLFWIELFDHAAPASVNSYACRKLAIAADVFEEFCAEAGLLEADRHHDETLRQRRRGFHFSISREVEQ